MMTKAPLFYEKKYGNFGSAKYGNVKVLQQKLPLTFFLLLAQLFFPFRKRFLWRRPYLHLLQKKCTVPRQRERERQRKGRPSLYMGTGVEQEVIKEA